MKQKTTKAWVFQSNNSPMIYLSLRPFVKSEDRDNGWYPPGSSDSIDDFRLLCAESFAPLFPNGTAPKLGAPPRLITITIKAIAPSHRCKA